MESQDFLQEYVEEVREHLQELEKSLLVLEREGKTHDEISQLFRAAHSIKGASAYMGFEQIAQLTHELESLFSEVQSNALEVTPSGISTLLSCVDFIADAVRRLQDSGAEPSVPDSLLSALQAIRQGGSREEPIHCEGFPAGDGGLGDVEVDFSSVDFPDMSSPVEQVSESRPDSEPVFPTAAMGEKERVGQLEEDDAELMNIFLGSFKESLHEVFAIMASPVTLPLTDAEFQQVMSCLRRLRSSSQYMDFEEVADLVLKGQEVVDRGRERSSSRNDVLKEFWTSFVEPLQALLPGLEVPDFRPEHAATPKVPETPSFQEDDEELLSIFVETFRQHMTELAALGDSPAGGLMTEARLDRARELIRKLIASSQYMDYDDVAGVLVEWEEKLSEIAGGGLVHPSRFVDLLYTCAERLESVFPPLSSLLPPRKPSDPSSILFDLEEEIDRSFDAFERATFGGTVEEESALTDGPQETGAETLPPSPDRQGSHGSREAQAERSLPRGSLSLIHI